MECMPTLLSTCDIDPINIDFRFLLARLHMDSIMSQPTRGDIKLALQNLPKGMKGLDETYKQAMERIESQGEGFRKLAKQILSWVTHAKRPLSTAELRHALAVKADMAKLDEDFLPEVEVLSSICAGLVIVDEQGEIVRLVHYTTQEYFERTSSFQNAETDITVTCVTYLSFDTFAAGFCPTDEKFKERLQLNPLYDYAAQNWGHHARVASAEVQQLIVSFLESEARVSGSSQAMMASKPYLGSSGYSQRVPRYMTGVHLTAYFRLRDEMVSLLSKGYYSDLKDTYGWTPLSWAARQGHESIVDLLLATRDVDPDSIDNNGRTPLSWAAEKGHKTVVGLLLKKKGVDLNSKDVESGQTPLSLAAEMSWIGSEARIPEPGQ